jgi:hypothetical protein
VGLRVQEVARTGSMLLWKNVVVDGSIVVHDSGSEKLNESRPTASAAGPVPLKRFAMVVFGGSRGSDERTN